MDFHNFMSLIFDQHYQWTKAEEDERNAVAIAENICTTDRTGEAIIDQFLLS